MTSLINPTNIDGSYPIAGQDNDSQGFRDNFTNIKNNLTTAQGEISDLQGRVILKSALPNTTLDNDMIYSKIIHPQLNSYSETFYDIGSNVNATQTLNYDLGNVQKFTTGASVTVAFSNWPASGQVGKLKFWIHVSSTAHQLTLPASCTIGFPATLIGSVLNGDGTRTITFTATGDYFYDFTTTDAGNSISVIESGRNATASSIAWTSVTGKPTFANVATSGAYTDLSNTPTIPAAQVQTDWNAVSGLGVLLNKPTLANVATSGAYTDLTGKPTIPTVVSAFTNDAGYLTSVSWGAVTGKPTVISTFTNDVGYLTSTSNAATATKLATPRLINGVSFDGSADITVPVNLLASALTGTVLSANVVSSSLTSVGTLTGLTIGGDAHLGSRIIVSTQLLTPSTGQTVQFDGSAVSIVHPGSTLAALTVIMPPSPTNNQIVTASFVDPITSLTMSAPSATITGALTAATANTFAKWIFISASSTWYRIG